MPQGTDGIVIVFRNTTGPGLRNISLLQPGYNLSVHAYEGGADTADGCGECSLEAKTNATRDPRLTDISVEHLKGWYRHGFEPYNWYSIGAGQTSPYGSWTLLEDMRQETIIDTTKMFNSTSPVAKLPRPAPKFMVSMQLII